MGKITEEDKKKNLERYKAIRSGEIQLEYVGVSDKFKEEAKNSGTGEIDAHSIGYLYAKGLYMAGYRPKKPTK